MDSWVITKITPSVKTAGRYNIFVNQRFEFSLDEAQLLELELKVGQQINQQQLANLKSQSQFGKNYIRALDLLSRRRRSTKEIRDYGKRHDWSDDSTERVIQRLYQHNYLDDEKFALSFIRSRAKLKNYSLKKMKFELKRRGIAEDIIDKTLNAAEEYDQSAALKQLIAKKGASYETPKLINYLLRQGFCYQDIMVALKEADETPSTAQNLNNGGSG
jgi:regulatory protein